MIEKLLYTKFYLPDVKDMEKDETSHQTEWNFFYNTTWWHTLLGMDNFPLWLASPIFEYLNQASTSH